MTQVTLNIEIATFRIREDIYYKSHLEVMSIEDPESRDVCRADEEKVDEIDRNILSADGELRIALHRWLSPSDAVSATNVLTISNNLTYQFKTSPRGADHKTTALAAGIHAYLVDSALAKFYTSVNQPNLAKPHKDKADVVLKALHDELYLKTPPTL